MRLVNCTLSDNRADQYGGAMYNGVEASPELVNCILWNNMASEGPEIALEGFDSLSVRYSSIQGGKSGIYGYDPSVNWGEGNIEADPCFADPGYWDPNGTTGDPNDDFWVDGDYHLKSEGWQWDRQRGVWTWDDVTSRCIDAGNPGAPVGQEPLSAPNDPNNNWGVNLRINMGAYGGTAEASIPPHDWAILSDITNDGTTDFVDFAHFAAIYSNEGDELFADFDHDGDADYSDLDLLTADWLRQTLWYEP
jgi:hypothetical protein